MMYLTRDDTLFFFFYHVRGYTNLWIMMMKGVVRWRLCIFLLQTFDLRLSLYAQKIVIEFFFCKYAFEFSTHTFAYLAHIILDSSTQQIDLSFRLNRTIECEDSLHFFVIDYPFR